MAEQEDKQFDRRHAILPGLAILHVAVQLWIALSWNLAPSLDNLAQPSIAYGYLLGWVATVVIWSVTSREPWVVRTLGSAALIWFSIAAFTTSAVASIPMSLHSYHLSSNVSLAIEVGLYIPLGTAVVLWAVSLLLRAFGWMLFREEIDKTPAAGTRASFPGFLASRWSFGLQRT